MGGCHSSKAGYHMQPHIARAETYQEIQHRDKESVHLDIMSPSVRSTSYRQNRKASELNIHQLVKPANVQACFRKDLSPRNKTAEEEDFPKTKKKYSEKQAHCMTETTSEVEAK